MCGWLGFNLGMFGEGGEDYGDIYLYINIKDGEKQEQERRTGEVDGTHILFGTAQMVREECRWQCLSERQISVFKSVLGGVAKESLGVSLAVSKKPSSKVSRECAWERLQKYGCTCDASGTWG